MEVLTRLGQMLAEDRSGRVAEALRGLMQRAGPEISADPYAGADLLPPYWPAWATPFLTSMQMTANVRLACQAAGISRAGYTAAAKKCPEFRLAVENARLDGVDILELQLRTIGLAGSEKALMFLLRHQRPEVYHLLPTSGGEGPSLTSPLHPGALPPGQIPYADYRAELKRRLLPEPEPDGAERLP